MSLDEEKQEFLRPRFARMREAAQYAAISRSRLYTWGIQHPALLRKNGTATVVDLQVLDGILDTLPRAELKTAR